MKIEYPMTENNVSHWGIWEAVREILQNAMDEEGFSVLYSDGILTVTNHGELTLASLLLGESDKASGSRGKYGEGMKMAMLVATRMDRNLVIYTGTQKWTPSLEHSDIFGCDLLCVEAEQYISNYVTVELSVEPSEWELIQSRYTTEPCGILGSGGDIFVGGLWVCNLPKFAHSYNFNVDAINLNRDRDIPNMIDVRWETTRLIEEQTVTGKKILHMAEKGSEEISEYAVNDTVLADAWEREHGDTVPIGMSEQNDVKATKYRIVPDWLATKIRSVKDFVYSKLTKSPVEKLEGWKDKHSSHLNLEALEELESIIKELS